MNFTDRANWVPVHTRVAGVVAVASALCLFTASAAHAMDLSRPVALPAAIDDGILEIGGQRLHLPPGHWVLTARDVEKTEARFRKIQTQGEGISAWAVLVADGRLQGGHLWLALPIAALPERASRTGQRVHGRRPHPAARLLAHPDAAEECLRRVRTSRPAGRSRDAARPQTLQWIRDQTTTDPGPVVRFLYKIRTDGTYGAISLVMPTGPFAGDAAAARWATGLRESTKAFFEGRTSDGELPPLPTPEASDDAAPTSGAAPRPWRSIHFSCSIGSCRLDSMVRRISSPMKYSPH